MSDAIPAGSYTATEILRLAREHHVPGKLMRRGRRLETRAYPVRLDSGSTLQWSVTALPGDHYVG